MVGEQRLRAGVDIGGTFTDLCLLGDEGIVAVGKTLTTHQEPAAGVESVLAATLAEHRIDPASVTGVVHGTTLVTNALIERTGPRTALLTTRGFRDVLEMRREHRYELYDLELALPEPLVPRWLRFEITERVLADGSVEAPVDLAEVRRLGAELAAAGVEAVAVCLLHGHVNPVHERAVRDALAGVAPDLRVALSSEVNPEIREYERTSTTVANVYVQALVDDYLRDLRERLTRLGIRADPRIMLSHGGVATIDTARRFPIRMLESGPAGGALGAVAFGRTAGRSDQLAFDMGGTTAKTCLIEDGRPLVSRSFEADRVYRLRPGSGLPVRAPVIDMIEIGAGGGSHARVDSLGLITVGPDSAGSEPGPVSYGRGGEVCTVTDADLVLGYLDPERFLGGRMRLDADVAARAVQEQVADRIGVSLAEAAWGIHATVNDNMANAARVHAVERGRDPAGLPVFVIGGNGPLHGPGVARALGCRTIVVPPAAGVLSAVGFLAAALSIDFVQSWHTDLREVTVERAREVFAAMEAEGLQVLEDSGVPADQVRHERSLDMRFVGQGSELEVPVPAPGEQWHARVHAAFVEQYEERFGTVAPLDVGLEILTWRVTARGPEPDAALRAAVAEEGEGSLLGHRDAYFPEAGGYVPTPVHDRYLLRAGDEVVGPALVQEREATLVLPPGATCTVEKSGSLVVTLPEGEVAR